MKKIYFSAIAVILMSCGTLNKKSSSNFTGPDNVPFFSGFVNAVPNLELPLEFTCGINELPLNKEKRDELKPFTPAGYEIIGKFLLSNDYNIILYGEKIGSGYYPHIFVTNSEGLLESNISLFKETCSSETSDEITHLISSNSKGQIIVLESRKDSKQKTLRNKSHIYEIDSNGMIKEQ